MIYIDWRPGYANMPSIEIHTDRVRDDEFFLQPRHACEFETRDGIWWHVQSNGLVQYFAHDGTARNNGGFGGAPFDILHNGIPRRLIGPWSSRAPVASLFSGLEIADVVIRQHSTAAPMYTGILVERLIELWDHDHAYLVRHKARSPLAEAGPFTASISPDMVKKPDGSLPIVSHTYGELEVWATPVDE